MRSSSWLVQTDRIFRNHSLEISPTKWHARRVPHKGTSFALWGSHPGCHRASMPTLSRNIANRMARETRTPQRHVVRFVGQPSRLPSGVHADTLGISSTEWHARRVPHKGRSIALWGSHPGCHRASMPTLSRNIVNRMARETRTPQGHVVRFVGQPSRLPLGAHAKSMFSARRRKRDRRSGSRGRRSAATGPCLRAPSCR